MLNLISMQIQTMCRKRGFQVTTFLLTVYALGTTVLYADKQKNAHITSLIHPALLVGLNEVADLEMLFVMLFPFLVVLPAGLSFFTDRNSRIKMILIGRSGKRKYYISKLIAGFLVTFLTFTIPFILELLLNYIVFPNVKGQDIGNWPIYSEYVMAGAEKYLFSTLYFVNPLWNILANIITLGIFAGCGAIFVMGISTFRIKYKSLLFLPFYLFMLYIPFVARYFVETGIELNLLEYIVAFNANQKSMIYYIIVMIILFLIGVVCTIWNEEKSISN